jgi:NAD+-processing family protein with receiver domain
MWKLFIDDIRNPDDDSWVIARTSDEAIELVEQRGIPQIISFDHDLGGDDTSMRFLGWMVSRIIEKNLTLPREFCYTVHSMNPVGAENIRGLMENVLRYFIRS